MPRWTRQTRHAAAQAIHGWKPWLHSTGPRTPAGKARVSRNAFKNSPRQKMRAIARLIRQIEKGRKSVCF